MLANCTKSANKHPHPIHRGISRQNSGSVIEVKLPGTEELFNKESPLLLANKKSLQHKIFSGKTAGLIEVNVVPPSDKEMGLKELGKKVSTVLFLKALESAYKLCFAILSDCGCCGLKSSVQLKICNYMWLYVKNDHKVF